MTQLLAQQGLPRGNGLKRQIMMCEVRQRHLGRALLEFFDGFSIGSNSLTQLTLGLDADSNWRFWRADFDERDPPCKR